MLSTSAAVTTVLLYNRALFAVAVVSANTMNAVIIAHTVAVASALLKWLHSDDFCC